MKAVVPVLILALVASCQAATYEVEWAIPPSKTSLAVKCGDTISLTWAGQHDLYKDAAGDCSSFSKATMLEGPSQDTTFKYNVTKSDGTFYFVCTIPGHCQSGQKLKVTSTCSTSSTKPPSPKPKSGTTAKPPSPKASTVTKPPSPKASTKPPSKTTPTESKPPSKTTPTESKPPSPSKTTSPVVSSPSTGNTNTTPATPPPETKPSAAVGGSGLGSAVAATAAAVLCFVAML